MTRPARAPADAASVVPDGFPLPIVLGVDPGTVVLGYGALVCAAAGPRLLAAGTLRVPGRAAVPERLGRLRAELDALIARLKPAVVVVEQAFAAANVQSALRIGEGRGVVLSCAAASGARVVQFPPASARKILLGNGGAGKEQVARMVATLLELEQPPRPLDVTDALALALAHVQRERGAEVLARGAARAARGARPTIEVPLEERPRRRGGAA